MRRRLAALATLAFTLTFVSGCTRRAITRDELPGTYSVASDGVTDTLWLRRDGVYEHRAWRGDVRIVSQAGTWQYPSDRTDSSRVDFSKFSPAIGTDSGPERPGLWAALVDRTPSGAVRFEIDPDLSIFYVKQSTD